MAQRDAAEANRASCDFDWDAVDARLDGERPETRSREQRGDDFAAQEGIIRVLSMILDSRDSRLEALTLASAFGIAFISEESFSALAAKHGITRQAYSKRVLRLQREFGLPPARTQKAKRARAIYSGTQQEIWAKIPEQERNRLSGAALNKL